MKILIGHDGSDSANSALRGLLKAGLPLRASAVVMSLPQSAPGAEEKVGGGGKESAISYSDEEMEKAAAMAKHASNMIRESFPLWEVRADLAVGSAVSVVAKKARQWGPNLIVLGLQRRMSSRRVFFSGVSQRIAIEADCSVRVAQAQDVVTDDAPRALLCVDGSPDTEAVVRAAAARDWPKGTELRLITVVNPFDYTIPEFVEKAIERAKLSHRIIANELDRTPAFTSSVVLEGEPAEMILREAAEWSPDAIFLAPRARNRWRRLLLNTVSGLVVARANCAVELARIHNPETRAAGVAQAANATPTFD
jgi:nucleotide-binding universal stress UspA family protein